MTKPPPNKWAAFLFSLAAPGSGQLLAAAWSPAGWLAIVSAVGWFAAVAVVGASFAAVGHGLMESGLPTHVGVVVLEVSILLAVGLASAIHARNLLEPRPWTPTRRASLRVQCGGRRGRAIAIWIETTTPLSPAQLWRRISNLPEFLTIDPFHEQVTLTRDRPAAGVQLVLQHNAFGRRFQRFGRILRWREGEGYAFSDLSAQGKRVGFPHIFIVSIMPRGSDETNTLLVVEVKGRWNSRVIPVWLGRLWIRLVCLDHARLLRRAVETGPH